MEDFARNDKGLLADSLRPGMLWGDLVRLRTFSLAGADLRVIPSLLACTQGSMEGCTTRWNNRPALESPGRGEIRTLALHVLNIWEETSRGI